MKKINKEEMKNVNGGAVKWGLIVGVGAFASFVLGVFDGWVNPQKCHS